MQTNTFDKLSFASLFFVIVLLPVFFLPFTGIPVVTSKGLLLVIGLSLSVIFWAIARFFDRKIGLPKSLCLVGGGGVVLVVLLSAIFSGMSQVSFFGTMLDIGTFWFIFAGFTLMLMSSIVFRNPVGARALLFGLMVSSAVVLVFQGFRIFLPDALSLGVLAGKTGNLLGSWSSLGLFAGLSIIVSLIAIEFFTVTKNIRWLLQALLLFSVVFVAAVNFPFVWELVGIVSLVIFVYKVSIISSADNENKDEKIKDYFPVFSFLVMIVALLFFVSGQFIGGILPNSLGLSNTEVRPSLRATVSVTQSVLKEDPVFGLGPNRFEDAWNMHKSPSINNSQFWDVSFGTGSGLLPTFASTTGYLGILAWAAFLLIFLITGVKSIFSSIKNNINLEMVAFFVVALYLFIASFFYATGPVIFLLSLAFAGVFVGLSTSDSEGKEFLVSFSGDRRKSFISIMSIILLVVVSAALSFKYVERFTSVIYFGKATVATTTPEAELAITRALALHQNDLYLRTYAQVQLIKFNSLVSKEESLTEAEQAELQKSFDQAKIGAEQAVRYNPKNYLNPQALGSIYQLAGLVGVEDAYSRATEEYKKASVLNPSNPRIKLAIANTLAADKKNQEAKDYANEALTLKANYIDAFLVLSQLARAEGDSNGALTYAEQALSLAPLNKDLINYVDALKNPGATSQVTATDDAEDENSDEDDNSTEGDSPTSEGQ